MKTLELQERLTEIFQHLHENPEVSWKEYETTAYITDFLKEEGISYRTFDDCPGVIAEIGGGNPVIAIWIPGQARNDKQRNGIHDPLRYPSSMAAVTREMKSFMSPSCRRKGGCASGRTGAGRVVNTNRPAIASASAVSGCRCLRASGSATHVRRRASSLRVVQAEKQLEPLIDRGEFGR